MFAPLPVRLTMKCEPEGRGIMCPPMTPLLPILAVSLGGILGANARYLVGVYVAERFGTAFPYGTLLINISGSLAIGFFLTLATERFQVDPLWRLFFATGFLGAYTTFSS